MRPMRPVSVDDLRPYREFDLRAFMVSAAVGVGSTVGLWVLARPKHEGATAASLDDAGCIFFGAFVAAPLIALVVSRRGGRAATTIAAIPVVFLIALAILGLRGDWSY